MKKFILLFFCVSFVLSGCSTINEEVTKNVVKQEINLYYENLLLEDLDKIMKQISTDSEQYYELYDEYRGTFHDFNNSYKINEISFNEISSERAVVSTSITINGVDENDKFDSLDVVQVFSFKPISDNVWKISSIETKYDF